MCRESTNVLIRKQGLPVIKFKFYNVKIFRVFFSVKKLIFEVEN